MKNGHDHALRLAGMWDAENNIPNLAEMEEDHPAVVRVDTYPEGYYYIVSTDGETDLNGFTSWKKGDIVVCINSVWIKQESVLNTLQEVLVDLNRAEEKYFSVHLKAAIQEIAVLQLDNWQLKGELGYSVPGTVPNGDYQCGICVARNRENSKVIPLLAKLRELLVIENNTEAVDIATEILDEVE